MGSLLGPLIANVFMCSIEEQLDLNDKMPEFYRRYFINGHRYVTQLLLDANSSINEKTGESPSEQGNIASSGKAL